MSQITAIDLRCEFRENPVGIDEMHPRLSWRMDDPRPDAKQTAYQILAASSPAKLNSKPDLWDSGRISSDQSLDISYRGKTLVSRKRVWWRVQLWGNKNEEGSWSADSFFEMGLLKKTDWSGVWIGRPLEAKDVSQPCPFLRREFNLSAPIASARLYATSRGCFEAHLNGHRVGSDYFTPGWTDYNKRIPYVVYDVTQMLRGGSNAIGAILADGWYAGHYVGWMGGRHLYGDQLSLLLQLEVEYEDGTREVITSGPDWKTSFGPLLEADHYNGETYDAQRELTGWASADYDDTGWSPAVVFDPPKALLVARRNLPVRAYETLQVILQTEPQFGVHVFDLGQNMVGWARVRIRGQAGDRVRIRFAEMLKDDGTLYTENLRSAKATDTYVCKGDGEDVYEPRFTFHGFRYVELTGLREVPTPRDVEGVVVYSGMPQTGTFECSHPKVNQLQSNIVWGQKGNFLEAPTDCPQRDERLGWTGDAQVFMPTACFNRDVAAFFDKWCLDLQVSQMENGGFPHTVPPMMNEGHSSTGWADAGVICPWTQYAYYGDKLVLERQFKSMSRWIDFHLKNSKGGVSTVGGFADWLALDMQEGNPGMTPTPTELISTAYFARVTDLMVRIAVVLERKKEAQRFRKILAQVKTGFNREFVSPNGRVVGDTQTGYLMALGYDLLPARVRPRAMQRLVELIERRGTRLTTGFLGTPLIAPVLSRFGRTDLAYKLLLQENYPSWFYSINQGATTMWERWNSYTKERGFGDVGMNSFNHYAYGCIGEWMYSTIAGIALDPNAPGYKKIIIQPQPGGGLTWAKGSLMSRYGLIESAWKIEDDRLTVDVTIPPNCTAKIILPGAKPKAVESGRRQFSIKQ